MMISKIAEQLLEENAAKVYLATAFIWYHYIVNQKELSIYEINNCFWECDLPKYNATYLKKDLRLSKNVTRGIKPNTYKPIKKYSQEMLIKFPFVKNGSEEILTDDSILPETLTKKTRGYIESLSRQINACYNYNIFDGCAILMRRLLEILLIHSYQAQNIESQIIEDDGFKNLSYIINYTCSNNHFNLSKDSINTLDTFKQLGNYSAHKIHYNAKRKDIDNIKLQYRMTIEELLYSSNIKN